MKKLLLIICLLFYFVPNETFAVEQNNQQLDSYIKKQMKERLTPGLSIVITKNGETIFDKSYGKGFENGRELTTDTKMYIASVSKPITATAIMQLVEAGKINLHDPVKKHLPYFQLKNNGDTNAITIEHLLSQTSGIPQYDGLRNYNDDYGKSIKDYIKERKNLSLTHKVGKVFHYSNTNYTILGAVIEEVSGQSFESYIQEHIFRPLGMNNSFASGSGKATEGLANGYQPFFGFNRPFETRFNAPRLPGGYIISTANDLAKFVNAYMEHEETILTTSSIIEMYKSRSEMKYGLGWFSEIMNGQEVVYHHGDQESYRATIAIIPSEKIGISIVTNANHGLAISSIKDFLPGLVTVLQGESPEDTWITPKNIYKVINFVVLAFIATLLYQLTTLKKWVHKRRQKGRIGGLITSFIQTLISLAILVGFPKLTQTPWETMFIYALDVASIIFILCIAFTILGLIKAIITIRILAGRKSVTSNNEYEVKTN